MFPPGFSTLLHSFLRHRLKNESRPTDQERWFPAARGGQAALDRTAAH